MLRPSFSVQGVFSDRTGIDKPPSEAVLYYPS
jgi:hypothetical protein